MTHYNALLMVRAYLSIEIDKYEQLHYGHAEHDHTRGGYYMRMMMDKMEQYTHIGVQLDKMKAEKGLKL